MIAQLKAASTGARDGTRRCQLTWHTGVGAALPQGENQTIRFEFQILHQLRKESDEKEINASRKSSFLLQVACVAYGNGFSQIYGREGPDYFFLSSSNYALRDLIEPAFA